MVATSEHKIRRFTAGEVERMVSAGVLDEDEPVQLLDGELVVMSPQGPPHAMLTAHIRRLLEVAYGASVHVRDHSPIDAGPYNRPEPDVALVRGAPRDYVAHHPRGRDVFLVCEIADTSRPADRRKAAIYAVADVPVYWIVDLNRRAVEVHSLPEAGRYAEVHLLGEHEKIALPELAWSLPVTELLP